MPALLENRRVWTLGGAALLALGVLAAYSNSFNAPLLFDDIRPYLSISRLPFPPSLGDIAATPLANRPLVAFTLVMNKALCGSGVFCLHAFNLLVHLAASLFLFGLLNRTLALPALGFREPWQARALALLAALAWALHPVQTESVTYVIQRCESLMGLFFLAALYCAVRGWQGRSRTGFHLAALACMALGAGAKESMVVMPLVLALYHWVFVQPGLAPFWRNSRILCLGSALFAVAGALALARMIPQFQQIALPFSALEYALNQARSVMGYLLLTVWPRALSLDHFRAVEPLSVLVPHLAAVACLLGVTVWLVARRHPAGFFAALFFLTLAPTSSLFPLRDIFVEHRLYLPLAGAIPGLLLLVRAGAARLLEARPDLRASRAARWGVLALCVAALVGLSLRTYARNADYAAGEAHMWREALRLNPDNPRARLMVGKAAAAQGKAQEAVGHLAVAFGAYNRLTRNDLLQAGSLLGGLLFNLGRPQEAFAVYEQSLALAPGDLYALLGYGQALLHAGQPDRAMQPLQDALARSPGLALAHFYLAQALHAAGRLPEAVASMGQALTGAPLLSEFDPPRMPPRAEALFHLGLYRIQIGDRAGGLKSLQEAARENPSGDLRTRILAAAAAAQSN